MEREQIIKALECHANGCKCGKCPMPKRTKEHHSCWTALSQGALALINELATERDGLKHHNNYLQGLINYVFAEKMEDFNSPSATNAVAEAEMWRRVALREKELVEENERLRFVIAHICVGDVITPEQIKELRMAHGSKDPVGEIGECGLKHNCVTDTVDKMLKKAKEHIYHLSDGTTTWGAIDVENLERIADEIKGGTKDDI